MPGHWARGGAAASNATCTCAPSARTRAHCRAASQERSRRRWRCGGVSRAALCPLTVGCQALPSQEAMPMCTGDGGRGSAPEVSGGGLSAAGMDGGLWPPVQDEKKLATRGRALSIRALLYCLVVVHALTSFYGRAFH